MGVDRSGAIVAQVLTDGTADAAKTGLELIEAAEGDITVVVGDASYDNVAVYDAASARGAKVIATQTRAAIVSRRRPRSAARDRTIKRVEEVVRRQWRKESGYHQRGTVENAIFRYKTIIGGSLRARHLGARQAEARLACNALNRMTQLGRPRSHSIGA